MSMFIFHVFFFFFNQKTAYEWRISDWSSDVCSSDLIGHQQLAAVGRSRRGHAPLSRISRHPVGAVRANRGGGRPRTLCPLRPLRTAQSTHLDPARDRKIVASGKSVSVRVGHGCRRIIIPNKKIIYKRRKYKKT